MMRAAFPATVHLFFFRDDRLLMLRRFKTGYRDGEYSLPAGHLDGGETIMAAAAREAREEVGVGIELQDISFTGVMHRREGEERVDFFVRVRDWQGEPFNAEPDKCDDLRWVEVGSLPENTVPYIRRAVQNLMDGVVFDEYGWESKKEKD
jgi:8-oxo-dGTP pyrophosphatase MutT (NUDIX family)